VKYWFFQFFFTKTFMSPSADKVTRARGLAEADGCNEMFAALKHVLQRQILLYLEELGEESFAAVQTAVGIEDTGLMNYDLKELVPLVDESERSKYS
jgi:hypothetical protein